VIRPMRTFCLVVCLLIFSTALADDGTFLWPRLLRITVESGDSESTLARLHKSFNVDTQWNGIPSVKEFEKNIDLRTRRVDRGQNGDGSVYEEWAVPLGQEDHLKQAIGGLPHVKRVNRLSLAERGSSVPPTKELAFQRRPSELLLPKVETRAAILDKCETFLKGRFGGKTIDREPINGETIATFSIYHLRKEVLPKYWQWLIVNCEMPDENAESWRLKVTVDLKVSYGLGAETPTLSEYENLKSEYADDLFAYQKKLVVILRAALSPK
jgi:hypothetical protein